MKNSCIRACFGTKRDIFSNFAPKTAQQVLYNKNNKS